MQWHEACPTCSELSIVAYVTQKREERRARLEAEQALRNKEVQRKAEEKQKKFAEAQKLEEQKSKEKKKQVQVMAKFLGQSETRKADGQDSLQVYAETSPDRSEHVRRRTHSLVLVGLIVNRVSYLALQVDKYGELKFLPLSPKSQTHIISHFGKPITKSIDENLLAEWDESALAQENLLKWKGAGSQRPCNNRKFSSLQQRTRRQLDFSGDKEDSYNREWACRYGRRSQSQTIKTGNYVFCRSLRTRASVFSTAGAEFCSSFRKTLGPLTTGHSRSVAVSSLEEGLSPRMRQKSRTMTTTRETIGTSRRTGRASKAQMRKSMMKKKKQYVLSKILWLISRAK